MDSDLTFITNEKNQTLLDRFKVLSLSQSPRTRTRNRPACLQALRPNVRGDQDYQGGGNLSTECDPVLHSRDRILKAV